MKFVRRHRRKFYITFSLLFVTAFTFYMALRHVLPVYVQSYIPEFIQYHDMVVEPFTGLLILRDVKLYSDIACEKSLLAEIRKIQIEISLDNLRLRKFYLDDAKFIPVYKNGKICKPPQSKRPEGLKEGIWASEGSVLEGQNISIEKSKQNPALNILSIALRIKEIDKENLKLIQILNISMQAVDSYGNSFNISGYAEVDKRLVVEGQKSGSKHVYSQGKANVRVPSLKKIAGNTKLPFSIVSGSASAGITFSIKQGMLDSDTKLMINNLKLAGKNIQAGPLSFISIPPQTLVDMLETSPGKLPFILKTSGDIFSKRFNPARQIKDQITFSATRRAEEKFRRKLMFWK